MSKHSAQLSAYGLPVDADKLDLLCKGAQVSRSCWIINKIREEWAAMFGAHIHPSEVAGLFTAPGRRIKRVDGK